MSSGPVTGTFEWAKYSEYCDDGCEHGCLYCYARKKAIRKGWVKDSQAWLKPCAIQKKLKKNFGLRNGTTMFPTTHDITGSNLARCIDYAIKILQPGNKLLLVSKPHLDCVKAMCDAFTPWQGQILFRFTIGSNYDNILKFWEPNAPNYEERKACLRFALDHGYQTSVSSEPFLDEHILELVCDLRPLVTDAIWIGKMNKIKERVDMTGWTKEQRVLVERVYACQTDLRIKALYELLKSDPKVKWKDSIKKVVGIARPTVSGADQ